MPLTAYPNPHHVRYPRGVQCLDCENFAPAELERCLACGSSAVALREDGEWEGGEPERAHPHFVELDASTGLIGYTRLSKDEIAEQQAIGSAWLEEQRKAEDRRRERLAALREHAKADPRFALVLEHLGIRTDG